MCQCYKVHIPQVKVDDKQQGNRLNTERVGQMQDAFGWTQIFIRDLKLRQFHPDYVKEMSLISRIMCLSCKKIPVTQDFSYCSYNQSV